MSELPDVHGMWIGSSLSAMELLTINSFTRQGYVFRLWAYNEINNIPQNVVVMDAGEIVAAKDVFNYNNSNKYGHGKGSYAGFSDIFRYKLLYEYGGIWVDMDLTCLAPLPTGKDYHFRYHKKAGVVGNYIKCPAKSKLMAWSFEEASKTMHADNLNWMLPIEILNEGIRKFEIDHHILRLTNDDSFPEVAGYLKPGKTISSDWSIMHWMNEEYRRLGIPKDACLEHSVFHQLCERFDVPVDILTGMDAMKYKWNISRSRYTYLSLLARAKWHLSK